jgi:hypothetical protein
MIQELNQEEKRMKRALCLVLALVLMLSASIALADAKTIDPKAKRNIKINKAGLNPSAEEMIDQGISPTTGRKLADLPPVDNFSGIVMTGKYQPVMVQISNASNGFNDIHAYSGITTSAPSHNTRSVGLKDTKWHQATY